MSEIARYDLNQISEALATARGEELESLHRQLEYLVARGHLSMEALFKLLDAREAKLNAPHETRARHFGEIAVDIGFISQAQLDAALSEQRVLGDRGIKLPLGQVLQRTAKLELNQILEVLRRQDKHVIACPCGKRYLIEHPKPDAQYQCSACHRTLEPPQATGLPPGTRVGPYRIESEMGRGRTGIVYRARDSADRLIALKILAGTDRERFLREAGALARLRHPHIVGVHQAGEAGEHLYVAMDYLEGRPLHRAALDQRRALVALEQVAEALAYAHEHHVVHRDLRAPNVIVQLTDGKPWAFVLDFACPPPGIHSGQEADLAALASMLGAYVGADAALQRLAAAPPASARAFCVDLRQWLAAHR